MGGGGTWTRGRETATESLAEALERTRERDAAAELARVFDETMHEINDVDTEAVQRHRETVCAALADEFDVHDVHAGGSRTRHTYVDGLSDIDLLLDLGPYSASLLPDKDDKAAVLRAMAARINQRLPNTEIKVGRMAVTIRFADGHELQVLPAFRHQSGYRIPDPQGTGWVVTRPRRFAELLRAGNAALGGKLLRAIKLGKLICGKADVGIKSYHLETIALQAFDGYTGSRADADLLGHLFNHAKRAVLRPTPDVTGQETHVDRYLDGEPGARTALARRLAAIEQTMKDAGGDAARWRAILDGDA